MLEFLFQPMNVLIILFLLTLAAVVLVLRALKKKHLL